MKENLDRVIVSVGCSPRATRFRYPVKVSGPADEEICFKRGFDVGCLEKRCYLGLWKKKLDMEIEQRLAKGKANRVDVYEIR